MSLPMPRTRRAGAKATTLYNFQKRQEQKEFKKAQGAAQSLVPAAPSSHRPASSSPVPSPSPASIVDAQTIPQTELTLEEENVLDLRGNGWKVAAAKRPTKAAGFKEGMYLLAWLYQRI
jgi:hypothetical protein